LLVAMVFAAFSARPDAGADLEVRYGYGSKEQTSMEAALHLLATVDGGLTDNLWFVGSARLRTDIANTLEPDEPAYDTYSDASRPWTLNANTTLELRDFYLEADLGGQLFRLGKQQTVWGSLDGIRVLDQLNPHSFREFILADFDESRINLWTFYADLNLAGWRTELLWTPDTTVHDTPEAGAWFELTAPRFRFGANADSPQLPVVTDLPQDVRDGTYGARISRQFGATEFRVQAHRGLDYEPLGRVIVGESGPVLERYYEQRTLYGFSLETSILGMILRGEFSAQPDRFVPVRPDALPEAARVDQFTGALGLDIDGPLGTFINLQYVHDRIDDPPDGLVRNEQDNIVTVFLRRTFAYEVWSVEARWYGNLEDSDGLGRLAIAYSPAAEVRFELSGDYFYGDAEGIFGQFAEKDRLTFAMQFRF
jgi:hypothetical protein